MRDIALHSFSIIHIISYKRAEENDEKKLPFIFIYCSVDIGHGILQHQRKADAEF